MDKIRKVILIFLASVILIFNAAGVVFAQPADYGGSKVSITFDDGFESTYTNALPVLSQRGMQATVYVTTDFIGQPGYMTWDQVISLQNDYGWEIGSHSVTHTELEASTLEIIYYELVESLNILLSYALRVANFASPFGAYDNNVLAVAAKYYDSHRGFWDTEDLNTGPYNRLVLMDKSVESSTTLADVYQYIDQARLENKWLVLTLHDVQETLDPSYGYITTISDLDYTA